MGGECLSLTDGHINSPNALFRVIDERVRQNEYPENGNAAPNAYRSKSPLRNKGLRSIISILK